MWPILKTEKRWYLGGAVFVFLFASVLMTGWPNGLIPNIQYPYSYDGDGIGYSWQIQRVIEGWVFDNPRNGYPFGSNFMDYPGSDAGSLLLLKIIGIITGSFYGAFNLYFLLTFALVFASSFVVLRSLDLSKPLSLAGGMVYAFLPFHFLRIDHYFFISYFVAPLFFYAAIRLFFMNGKVFLEQLTLARALAYLAVFIALASFGVYYALFGTILMGTVVLICLFRAETRRNALIGCLAISAVCIGVLVNTAPNIIYKQTHGSNSQIMHRSAAEAEHYGLKMAQLFLPRPGHRIDKLAAITDKYNKNTPLVNENLTSSLGFIGSLGFAAIAIILLRSCAVSGTRKVLIILSALTSVLFLFGTIGGLGSLFSSLISSSIRGWNRISVFIGFGSIAVFLLLVDYWTQRLGKCRQPAYVIWLSAILIGVIGFYDQTTRTCPNCNDKVRKAFESDRQFISAIEGILPTGSAVYQLPYIVFPEGAIINRLGSYDMLAGFLHSRTLKWNLGGMKEREGDLFYKSLSQQSLKQQIDTIQTLGFAGIYVDKRGFADDGKKIENDLSLQFGKGPDLVSASGDQIFYALPKPTQNVEHLSSKAIMQLVNYQNTESAQVTFGNPIEFSQVQLPSHVEKITGLSNPEPWGRWSDANQSPSVTVKFKQPLPHQFNLVIEAKSFVAEPNQRLRITIGAFVFEPKLTSDFSKITIPVNLDQEVVDKIVLTPQKTVSPSALGLGSDNRELGVGLTSLQIEPSTTGSFKK